MLSKNDKEFIKKELRNLLLSSEFENFIGNIVMKAANQAFHREMVFEDGKTEKGKTIQKTKNVNLIDQLVFYFPHVEAALRGTQETVDHLKNTSASVSFKLEAIGNALLAMEGSAKKLAFLSDFVKDKMVENKPQKKIIDEKLEGNEDESDS